MGDVLPELVFLMTHRRRISTRRAYGLRRRCGALAFSLLVIVLGADPALAAAPSAEVPGLNGAGGGPTGYLLRFYQKHISDLRYGRCRFDPSCSQYAIDAIEEEGFVKGSSLAADRLIRCNQHAEGFYAESPTGRLSDPVDRSSVLPGAPRVPDWLLPDSDRAFPLDLSFPAEAPDSVLRARARVREDIAFAHALAAAGDCDRAVTEYKRVAFASGSEDAALWSFFKIGDCYFEGGDWEKAAAAYAETARRSPAPSAKNAANYMAAASHFNAGKYGQANACLDRCASGETRAGDSGAESREERPDQNRDEALGTDPGYTDVCFLRGLSALALGEWSTSVSSFAKAAGSCADSLCGRRASVLRRRAEEGASLPVKHPNLAAGLSAVLPGSGQAYAGRAYDGLRHLVFDGLLIFTIYQLADDDLWGAAYLVAGITLPFYVGNIIGARRSAENHNMSKRAEFVSQALKETSMDQ
ncbi:MAG: rane protein insertion efficiency factor YidD [Candidatus Krumholzibacteriota bacterium]|nr:rane protein insertion efficiency factor YidD [Candidatus Krumholzibacteriota bacterium]